MSSLTKNFKKYDLNIKGVRLPSFEILASHKKEAGVKEDCNNLTFLKALCNLKLKELKTFLNFENSFKLSILTLTNTATSNIYGIEQIQFANLFTFSKISLIIFMVIAKVELLTIFILVRKLFFKD